MSDGDGAAVSGTANPNVAALTARLDALEAQVAIRAVMADYMRLCDRLDAATPMDQLGDLFTRDAVWKGIGSRYGKAFGGHHGRDAIIAMLNSYRDPPHFSLNAHFLTSEKITVDGTTAEGQWMMLQAATYSSGSSDLRSAQLTVSFVQQTSRWQISRFQTDNIFLRPIDRWDGGAPLPVPER